MYRYNILDFRCLNYIVTVILAGVAMLTAWLMWCRKARMFTVLLLILSLFVTFVGIYGMREVVAFSSRLQSNSTFSEYEMSILVPATSEVTDVHQLNRLLAPASYDQENVSSVE